MSEPINITAVDTNEELAGNTEYVNELTYLVENIKLASADLKALKTVQETISVSSNDTVKKLADITLSNIKYHVGLPSVSTEDLNETIEKIKNSLIAAKKQIKLTIYKYGLTFNAMSKYLDALEALLAEENELPADAVLTNDRLSKTLSIKGITNYKTVSTILDSHMELHREAADIVEEYTDFFKKASTAGNNSDLTKFTDKLTGFTDRNNLVSGGRIVNKRDGLNCPYITVINSETTGKLEVLTKDEIVKLLKQVREFIKLRSDYKQIEDSYSKAYTYMETIEKHTLNTFDETKDNSINIQVNIQAKDKDLALLEMMLTSKEYPLFFSCAVMPYMEYIAMYNCLRYAHASLDLYV